MQASKDEEIPARALQKDRVMVSAESDFGTLLAMQEAARPSFVLFRRTNLVAAHDYLELLLSARPTLEPKLVSGVLPFSNQSAMCAPTSVLRISRRQSASSFRSLEPHSYVRLLLAAEAAIYVDQEAGFSSLPDISRPFVASPGCLQLVDGRRFARPSTGGQNLHLQSFSLLAALPAAEKFQCLTGLEPLQKRNA